MKVKYKKIVLMILVSFTIFQTSCRKEKNRICDLYDGSVGYAIGTVEFSISVPVRVNYTYSFVVDGINYEGTEKSYGIGQDDNRIVGRQFVVIYQLGSPDNSDLNIDYSIESDQDFIAFEEKYENNPPSPDFPNKCK